MDYGLKYQQVMETNPANGKFCPKVPNATARVHQPVMKSCANLSSASEYIKSLEVAAKAGRDAQNQLSHTTVELDCVKRENDSLRSENQRLFQEMEHYRESGRQRLPAAHPPPPPYAAPPVPVMADPSRSLPPLVNGAPAASSMQGVQYSETHH